jgi:hypothetical protein
LSKWKFSGLFALAGGQRRYTYTDRALFSDFEIGDGESFGDWRYADIAASAHIEKNGSIPDRVREATERLQQHDDRER